MVNTMLGCITNQLYDRFGGDYTYYKENVEQGLTKPAFTVDSLLPLQRSRNRLQYERTIPVVVHYFSDDMQHTKQDCYDKAELIVEALEYVPYENTMIRGEDISWQMVEDVLQVFITYRFITQKITSNEDIMEDVTQVMSATT